jgi:hypothetical protein
MYHVVVRGEVEYAGTVLCLAEASLLRASWSASCTPRPLVPIQLERRRTAALVRTLRIQVRVHIFAIATEVSLRVVHPSVAARIIGFCPNRFRGERGGQGPRRRGCRWPLIVARLTADARLRDLIRSTASVSASQLDVPAVHCFLVVVDAAARAARVGRVQRLVI